MLKIIKFLLDLLFPLKCIFCGNILNAGTFPAICHSCNLTTPRLGSKCPKCGAIPQIDINGRLKCHTCHVANRHYDVAFSVYRYNGNVRRAILKYKFYSGVDFAKSLTYDLAKLVTSLGYNIDNIDYIICVPPDKKRLKDRGYDHIKLISKEISSISGIPIKYNAINKIKKTKAQSLLTRKGRTSNVKGAYRPQDGINLQSSKVLLIDDVLTTGSTVNEVSRVLKRAGVEYIAVFTIAYATR